MEQNIFRIWVKRFSRNVSLMIAVSLCAAMVAALAAMRLRYAHPFKPLFAQTCIYIPDNEVAPTLVVFVLSAIIAAGCCVNGLIISTKLRGFALGLAVALAAFGIALLVHNAI